MELIIIFIIILYIKIFKKVIVCDPNLKKWGKIIKVGQIREKKVCGKF